MNASTWQRAKSLLADAADLPAADRERFVIECCPDLELRRQVLELLASPAPLSDIVGAGTLLSGARLGPYVIERLLGAGGMGEVYKARDTRLDRTVAIKVLAAALAGDPQFQQRFHGEARTISRLDHPHICVLYDVGDEDGHSYLVMQYLEGETLADRLRKGVLPPDRALRYGMQIADALETAHAQGIAHRDIKPANIFITGRDAAVVLDFGLAKQTASTAIEPKGHDPFTKQGSALGTIAYASPEQARGDVVDARTDLWSLGVVLYEMVTGSRPFEGSTHPLVVADPTSAPPSVRERNPTVPLELERIIFKCLDNSLERRYQHASAIRTDLQRLAQNTGSSRLKSNVGRRTAAQIATRWPIMALAAAAMLASLAAGRVYFHHTPTLTTRDTLVLADFVNATGDPVFDGTLRQGLIVQLQQSPFLSLVSEERIQGVFRLMGRPAESRITLDLARQVCARTASAAVLEGSIAGLGSRYVLGLRARYCGTGGALADEQVQVARKEDVLDALTQIARRFRARVGESLATVKLHDVPLAEATTPSLEALKAFSTGTRLIASQGHNAALPFFTRATEIDPEFASAYAWMGRSYGAVGESGLAKEFTATAWRLRDRVSDQEKFYLDFSYHRVVTGDLEKAAEIGQSWARTYPRDVRAHALLAGSTSTELGRFEQAGDEAKTAIGLDPDHSFAYSNLAQSYVERDRLADAQATLRRALDRKLDTPEILILQYQIAFLENDSAEMQRLSALGLERSDTSDWMYGQVAAVLGYSGHLVQARTMSLHAIEIARQAGRNESAAQYEAAAAVQEALVGNTAAARRAAASARALSEGRDAEYGAAVALALSGDSSRPQTLANDLEKRFPQDTSVRFGCLPTLHALLALNRHDPLGATALLEAAAPYELAWRAAGTLGFSGSLYPIYVRGEAFLMAGQGAEAVAEFQRILDHRGIVGADPIGVFAHLQLGRAAVLAGDMTRAKAAYREFLTVWNNADPDIPILAQANAEYARLQ